MLLYMKERALVTLNASFEFFMLSDVNFLSGFLFYTADLIENTQTYKEPFPYSCQYCTIATAVKVMCKYCGDKFR